MQPWHLNLFERKLIIILKKILKLNQETLEELVRFVGFMKNKSKAIKTLAKWYIDHNEDPVVIVKKYGPKLRKTLLSLHGVGPETETADVLLAYIFDFPQFISDKYARTLFTQLGINGLIDYKILVFYNHINYINYFSYF
uniref:DNAse I n=1 Tax=Piromyces sp. TaxID=45796 RepID=A0A2S1TZH0_PIRSP|nr:DNAse I [Piromyces sp.]